MKTYIMTDHVPESELTGVSYEGVERWLKDHGWARQSVLTGAWTWDSEDAPGSVSFRVHTLTVRVHTLTDRLALATDANGESRAVVSAEDVDPLAAAVEVLREVCRG